MFVASILNTNDRTGLFLFGGGQPGCSSVLPTAGLLQSRLSRFEGYHNLPRAWVLLELGSPWKVKVYRSGLCLSLENGAVEHEYSASACTP